MQLDESKIIVNNKVKVFGVIINEPVVSHEVYGEVFNTFDLKVPRLSEHEDILPITVSERLISANELIVGQKIAIEGQVRSYNNFVKENNKNKLVLTVFAREIKHLDEDANINNVNEIFLNGFVCKNPIYRTTPFGREIADILVAVNRPYGKSDYIPCIAWGRNAKFSQKIEVSDKIKIYGRLQSRAYQKKIDNDEIIEKTAYEVSISKFEIEKE